MADFQCVNSECPEHAQPKTNPSDYPIEAIRCGACGQPVEPIEAGAE